MSASNSRTILYTARCPPEAHLQQRALPTFHKHLALPAHHRTIVQHTCRRGLGERGTPAQAIALVVTPQGHGPGRDELQGPRQRRCLALRDEALAERRRGVRRFDADRLLQDLRPVVVAPEAERGRHGEGDGAARDADARAQRRLDGRGPGERRQKRGVAEQDLARTALDEGLCQQGAVHVVHDDEELGLQLLHCPVQVRREVKGCIGALVDLAISSSAGVGLHALVVVEGVQTVAEKLRLLEAALAQDDVFHAIRPCQHQCLAVRIRTRDRDQARRRGRHLGRAEQGLHRRDPLAAGQDQDLHAADRPRILQRRQDLWEGQRDTELGQHQPRALCALDLDTWCPIRARDQLADHERLLMKLCQHGHRLLLTRCWHDEDHAQTTIESGDKLLARHLTDGRKPSHHSRQLPSVCSHLGRKVRGQNRIEAMLQAAMSNLHRTPQEPRASECQNGLCIDACGWQQGVAEAACRIERGRLAVLEARSLDYGTNQREAVAVEA
mmetsp:Transcript_32687/g.107704  ORF Transcript_32687/g.107704 Transcript_32687/m.107704 type:complete len:498 (+) Transcript_32687:111-1604(+)